MEYDPSGCVSVDTIEVATDIDLPSAVISDPNTINCYQSSALIEAEMLSAGNFIFSWTSSGADYNMIDSLSLESFGGGVFTLEILNIDNNCSASFEVDVPIDTLSPEIIMDSDLSINCYQDETVLDASSSSSGANFDLEWNPSPGLIGSVGQPYVATAVEEGVYSLSILNTDNGCSSTESFEVLTDTLAPELNIISATVLDCELTDIQMFAQTVITDNSLEYEWQSANGSFSSSTNQSIASTQEPGLYTVVVSDLVNGCVASDFVQITQDTIAPDVVLAVSNELNCLTPTAIIESNGSSLGAEFSYAWSSNNISFADPSALSQEVNSGGQYTLEIENIENHCTSLAQLDLAQNFNTPNPDIDQIGQLDCVQDELLLNGNGTVLPPQYKVEWLMNGISINGEDELELLVSSPGTYQLNITDISSYCKGSKSIDIDEDLTIPDLSVMPYAALDCQDTIISLTAVKLKSTYSFMWNSLDGNIVGAADTTEIQVSAAGTYQLTVTDAINGCKDSMALTVEADQDLPELLSSNVPDLTCLDSMVLIQTTVEPTGSYTFEWSGPGSGIVGTIDTDQLLVSQVDQYQLQLTNTENHCQNYYVFDVEGDLDLPDFEIEGDLYIDCYEPEAELYGVVDQPEKFAFEWQSSLLTDNGASFPGGNSIIVTQPGTYILTLTDLDNGCHATQFIEVEGDLQAPVLLGIQGDELNCIQDQVWLDASISQANADLTIAWSSPTGQFNSVQDSSSVLAGATGYYFINAFNPVNGCSTIDSFYVNSNLDLPEFEVEETYILNCDLPKIENNLLTNVENPAVLWFDAGGTVIGSEMSAPSINEEGLYSFELTDLNNGCKSNGAFEVLDHRLLDFDFTFTDPVCSQPFGSIEILDVEGSIAPFTYGLSNDGALGMNTYFNGLASGQYNLTVEDLYGCQLSKSVTLAELPDLDISVESQQLIQVGESYQVDMELNFDVSDISSVQWSPPFGVSCTDCLEPVLQPEQQQTYTVEILTHEGCLVERDLMIVVRDDQSIFAPNIFSPDGDGFNDEFRVFASKNYQEVKSFMIYDRWGELVYQEGGLASTDDLQGWDGNFAGKSAQVGVYTWFVELLNKQGIWEIHKGDISLYR